MPVLPAPEGYVWRTDQYGDLRLKKEECHDDIRWHEKGFQFCSPLFEKEKEQYISLNKAAIYQKGNSTYILPLKKKVLLDKVTFNPDYRTR